MRKILLLEDERNVRYAVKRVLEEAGFSVKDIENPHEIDNLTSYSLLILDIKLKNTSGIDFLRTLREKGFSIPVVVITAYANPENIISASRYGAIDILKKPFGKEELLGLVRQVLKEEEPSAKKPEVLAGGSIIGDAPSMMEVFKKVGAAASSDMTVLLVGETGVGKDFMAKVIHENSLRKDAPFVAINCSAIPETLFEAELFGCKKGAFTGAIKDVKGKVEIAEGGTLFLDEIGDIPYPLQSKLLRFLEDKSFYRLGDDEERKADVRIIAATNRDLQSLVEKGKFREDLYYRLSQLTISIPPLRERKEDIPKLINFFIKKANDEFGTQVRGVSKSALEEALNYTWKGNIRELKNTVYKRVLEVKEGYIENLQVPKESIKNINPLVRELLEALPEGEIKRFLPEMERELLSFLMERYGGNKSKIAELLNISRNTLRVKLSSYGIEG